MALPQQIVRDLGGTIDTTLLLRPDTAPPTVTATVRGPTGSVYVDAQTATVDAVNTTLTAAPARGATTVAVASATGIVVGREYLVGDNILSPSEIVRVRGVATLTITLSRPLLNAHANASGFVGTRLTYAVTAAQASAFFFDGHIEWRWGEGAGGGAANRWTYGSIECVRRRHERLATPQDVFRREPKLFQRMSAEVDINDLLATAYDDTMEKAGGQFRVRTVVGSESFIRPTVYRALNLLAAGYGRDYEYLRDHYKTEWEEAVTSLVASQPADNDQDGIIESHEGGTIMVRVN